METDETEKGETATQGMTAERTRTAEPQTDPDLEPLLLLGVLREHLQKMGVEAWVHKHPLVQGAVQLEAKIDGTEISVINDMQNGRVFLCTATTFEVLISEGRVLLTEDEVKGHLSIEEIEKEIEIELLVQGVIKGIQKNNKWNEEHRSKLVRVDIDWLISLLTESRGKFSPVLTGIDDKETTIRVLKEVRKRGYTEL